MEQAHHHDIHDIEYGGKRYNQHWEDWLNDPKADHTPAGVQKHLDDLFKNYPKLAQARSKGFCVTKGYHEFKKIRDKLLAKYGNRLTKAAANSRIAKKLAARMTAKVVPGLGQVVSGFCFFGDWWDYGFAGAAARATPYLGAAIDAKDMADALAGESEDAVNAELRADMVRDMTL